MTESSRELEEKSNGGTSTPMSLLAVPPNADVTCTETVDTSSSKIGSGDEAASPDATLVDSSTSNNQTLRSRHNPPPSSSLELRSQESAVQLGEQDGHLDLQIPPGTMSPSTPKRHVRPMHTDEPPEAKESLSELSDPEDRTEVANSPGRKVIHDFFFPPRRQAPRPLKEDDDDDNNDGFISPPMLGEKTRMEAKFPDRLGDGQNDHETHGVRLGDDDDCSSISSRQQRLPETPTLDAPHADTTPQLSRSRHSMRRVGRTGGEMPTSPAVNDGAFITQEQQDKEFVEKFWTAYDEILILSLFTQIGILCRLGAAYWFRYFDGVFHADSALFTNLPLNCLSCFVMGLLCSGESLMEIISTRFTPPRLQQDLHREAQQSQQYQSQQSIEDSDEEELVEMETAGVTGRLRQRGRRHGRRKRQRARTLFQNEQNQSVRHELREVQLLAWERRIRASICLLLFPVKQKDVDVVENYFSDGFKRGSRYGQAEQEENGERMEEWADEIVDEPLNGMEDEGDFDDLILQEEDDNGNDCPPPTQPRPTNLKPHSTEPTLNASSEIAPYTSPSQELSSNLNQPISESPAINIPESNSQGRLHATGVPHIRARQYAQVEGGNVVDYGTHNNPDLDQFITNVATGVSKNISRIGRVNLANGWDVGTSPEEKSADLMLGLRDGLCGALSSFSSWISSMVHLFRTAQIGQAFVGLMLGIQLPLIAYRFGQYISVYIFVWRCRREKRQDERRGYGIQLHMDEEDPADELTNRSHQSFESGEDMSANTAQRTRRTKGRRTVHDEESEVPSVRAIITALFTMSVVAQLTSLNFFYEPEKRLLALSMLFSPLGVLVRWRMMKFNSWRESFPMGTFSCNVTACALSGTLGTLLAGNPGPRERIVLVSIIDGFGGTLSSVARFIVEIIAGMDPILFRLDGVYYAVASVFWGLMVSLIFSASVDWADQTEASPASDSSP